MLKAQQLYLFELFYLIYFESFSVERQKTWNGGPLVLCYEVLNNWTHRKKSGNRIKLHANFEVIYLMKSQILSKT